MNSSDLCLFGNHDTGAGWLASHDGNLTGTGDPVSGRSFTEAVWQGCGDLRRQGADVVRVFAPNGLRMALVDLRGHVPTFGELSWVDAPQFEVHLDSLGRES